MNRSRPTSLSLNLAGLAVITGVTAWLVHGMWGWTYDDVFIIYRYARNVAAGRGLVYNPGEYYLGTTSALYTILLATMHLVPPNLDFVLLGSLVSTVGIWFSGALIWWIGLGTRAPLAGLLGSLATVVNPLIVESFGGEMLLLLPLVLGAIYCYGRDWGVAAGVLLGLALLTRPDSAVLAGLILSHYLWSKRRIPVVPALGFAAVVLPWLAYSWLVFGSPLPGTLAAKIAQGKAGWPLFLGGALDWLHARLTTGPQALQVFLLLTVGAFAVLLDTARRRPMLPWLLVFGWGVLSSAAYIALGVAFYGWYAVPLSVAVVLLMAWGLVGVARAAAWLAARALDLPVLRARHQAVSTPGVRYRPLAIGAPALLLAVLVGLPVANRIVDHASNFVINHSNPRFTRDLLYSEVGKWLADRGGPRVSVAYLEVGRIGYYSNSRLVDLLGLVTPGVSAHVPSHDYGWAVQHYQPDYYLALDCFSGLLGGLDQTPWFQAAFAAVAIFETFPCRPGVDTSKMIVYKRKVTGEP